MTVNCTSSSPVLEITFVLDYWYAPESHIAFHGNYGSILNPKRTSKLAPAPSILKDYELEG
jgi:hypothetical protein